MAFRREDVYYENKGGFVGHKTVPYMGIFCGASVLCNATVPTPNAQLLFIHFLSMHTQ